jgi:hypothetical protein
MSSVVCAREGGRVVVAPVLLAGLEAEGGHLLDLELLELGLDVDVDVHGGVENGEPLAAGVALSLFGSFHCESSVRVKRAPQLLDR